MTTIDVKGNSGCNIEIVEKDNKLFIHKTTSDPNYYNRLISQGKKQRDISEIINVPRISIPKVNFIGGLGSEAMIVMDYIYSKNFIDFFEYASPRDIDDFCESICLYIEKEINHCKMTNIDKNIFLNKLSSIYTNCKNNSLSNNDEIFELLDRAKTVFNNLNNINIPIGLCHGDLTLSNILFSNNGSYYIIDFLDSFIETPLQDIVKLRQDSFYHWSVLMYSKKYDQVRINMVFDYIDLYIKNYFNKYDWFNNNYNIIQLINLIRILPYAKDRKILTYLIKNINNLINEIIGK